MYLRLILNRKILITSAFCHNVFYHIIYTMDLFTLFYGRYSVYIFNLIIIYYDIRLLFNIKIILYNISYIYIQYF